MALFCLPSSFATGCVVTGGNMQCSCKPGYTGTQCERWVLPLPQLASPPPILQVRVGSAGRLLQAPGLWAGGALPSLGSEIQVGLLVTLKLEKHHLGSIQDCTFNKSLTSFSFLFCACFRNLRIRSNMSQPYILPDIQPCIPLPPCTLLYFPSPSHP